MKMKDIEIGKDYAVLRGPYGPRPTIEKVEGLEGFNPNCRKYRIVAINVERKTGFNYATGTPKMSKSYIKAISFGRLDSDSKPSGREETFPSRNVVCLWSDYQTLGKRYWAEVNKRKKAEREVRETLNKEMKDLAVRIGKVIGITVGYWASVSRTEGRTGQINLSMTAAKKLVELLEANKNG